MVAAEDPTLGSFAKFSLAAAACWSSRSSVSTSRPGRDSPSSGATRRRRHRRSDCVDLYADGGTYRATVGNLGVTATVPAGWHGLRDQFYLLNAPCIFGGSTNLEVALVNDVYADACDWRGTDVKATTPAAVTAALAAQEGHDTIGPTDVTIGGYPEAGSSHLPSRFRRRTACDDGTMWLFPGEPDPGIFNIDPGTAMSVHVVDVDGSAVVVAARIRAEDATPAAISEPEDIVDSLRFEPGEVEAVHLAPRVAIAFGCASTADGGRRFDLPGTRDSPAGEYGWEGGPRRARHAQGRLDQSRRRDLRRRCRLPRDGRGSTGLPVRVAGLEGVSVEPYSRRSRSVRPRATRPRAPTHLPSATGPCACS